MNDAHSQVLSSTRLETSSRHIPPNRDPLLLALAARIICPLWLRQRGQVHSVHLSPEAEQLLLTLRQDRVMVCSNHPSYEAPIWFAVGARLGIPLCFMANREFFDRPVEGWLIRRVGAYSVARGQRDREAAESTIRLLTNGGNWVVMFPEGENHHMHSVVAPFLPGAARLGLQALARLDAASEPVYLLPVAARYYYTTDMRARMRTALSGLERELDMAPVAGWQARLLRIADRVISASESHYRLTPLAEDNLRTRLVRLREQILTHAVVCLGIQPASNGKPLLARIRRLLTEADISLAERRESRSAWQRRVSLQRSRQVKGVRSHLKWLLAWYAVDDMLEVPPQSVEDFMDVVERLERGVYGRSRYWARRAVELQVGRPIDLRLWLDTYHTAPVHAIDAVTWELENAVRGLLTASAHLMTPLPEQR